MNDGFDKHGKRTIGNEHYAETFYKRMNGCPECGNVYLHMNVGYFGLERLEQQVCARCGWHGGNIQQNKALKGR